MASIRSNCSGNKRTRKENDETRHEPNKKIPKLNTRSLVSAIKKQDIEKVGQFLLEQKSNYIPEGNTVTPLHHAAESGNIEIVKLLFDHGYGTVNVVNKQKKTPLQLAMKKNHVDVIKYLLENGAKNALSPVELQDLIYSHIETNKSEILKTLVKGENISDFLIDCAVEKNHLESLKSLLEFGNVTNKNNSHYDFLHTAAKNGNLEILKLFFNNGYDIIGARNNRQVIPLQWAVDAGHEEVVKFLLDNGAKDKLSFNEFNNLIKKCIASGYLHILKSLNSTDTVSASVLNFAASNGHLEILKLLMECGVKIQSTSETPLQCAARHGHLEIVKYLIESGNTIIKSVDCSVKAQLSSETPLHCAAKFGRFEIVEYLIENGLFINKNKTFNGLTPLELAITNGHLQIVKYFFKKEADGTTNYLRERNETNYSPLHYAASHGHLDILKYLIENGADINVKANDETPLHKAVRSGHVGIVRELLELGAKELDVPNNISAPRVKEEIFTMLIKAGHSLEEYFGGRKPILIAAQLGYTKLVEALLSSGVDVDTREKRYETVLNLAVISRKAKVVDILLKAGANLKGSIITRLKPLESCIRRAYWTRDFRTQVEILRNLLDHVPKGDLKQMVVSCINLAIKEKTSITIIDILLEYDFNNNCELTLHCLASRIHIFKALIHHIEKVETLINFQDLIIQKCEASFVCHREAKIALVSRIVFLKSLPGNSSIGEETHLNFVNQFKLEEWCKNCEKEIVSMKETKISPGESDVTYYDLLAKHIHKVVYYVRNEKLITNLNFNGFVIYKEFFERRISRARNRSLYVDQSQKSLYNMILNGFQIHLPNEIIDKISEYLTVVQLDRLQKAFL